VEAQGGRRCGSYSFMTSALDGVSGQRHAPTALYIGGKEPQCPLDRTGLAPELVWTQRLEEDFSLPLPGIEPRLPGRPVRSHTLY
jgi:hypothetical protein